MHRPVRFSADIEPLVQFIEETDPKRILEATLGRLRDGLPVKRLLTASALAVTRSSDFVSIAVCRFSPTLIGTRRGLAFSAIGSRKVNTPSAYWASMRSVSSVSPKNN